jgi:hypothetical protein
MPKRTKATKKTDEGKAWNRKAKPSAYQIDTIPINKTMLIVCEGQTEKLYFESFPVLGAKIEVIDLKGQSKLKLVELTDNIIENSEFEYDVIWCVFDMDVKRGEKEFADFDNSINKAIQSDYKVAYSNDAFELWFYLHYNYTETQNLRNYYYDELSKRWSINYVKDGKKRDFSLKIYQQLLNDPNNQVQAISRAKKLYEQHKHLAYHKQNPVTMVYELVKELNENLRR